MEVTLGTWKISVERTPPTDTELAAMYGAVADHWHERLGLLGYPQAYYDLFDRLLADGLLGSMQGRRILDCGIGTAALSLALARWATPLQIDGVDVSPGMLAQARRNLKRASVEARLHLCDVREMPFGNDTFDAVMGAHVLEHLDDPLEGLSKMARVLRPGGPLVVVVTRCGVLDELLRLRWSYALIEQDQLVYGMEEAGLTGVRTYPLLAGGSLPRRTSVACVAFKKGADKEHRTQKSLSVAGTDKIEHTRRTI